MLRENPQLRPNIYQVVHNVCFLRGTDIPIKDVGLFSAGEKCADIIRFMAPEMRLSQLSSRLGWLVRIKYR